MNSNCASFATNGDNVFELGTCISNGSYRHWLRCCEMIKDAWFTISQRIRVQILPQVGKPHTTPSSDLQSVESGLSAVVGYTPRVQSQPHEMEMAPSTDDVVNQKRPRDDTAPSLACKRARLLEGFLSRLTQKSWPQSSSSAAPQVWAGWSRPAASSHLRHHSQWCKER